MYHWWLCFEGTFNI